jgi:hypothetical protein
MRGSKEFGPDRVPEPHLAEEARRAYGRDVQDSGGVRIAISPTSPAALPADRARKLEEARKAWYAYGDD